jgi:hypothetical protein
MGRADITMAEIIVSGKIVLVDDEDLCLVSCYKWYITEKGYVAATLMPPVGTYIPHGQSMYSMRKTVYMHRIVLRGQIKPWQEVDHDNRIKTDNRKRNLIPKTHAENMLNIPVRRPGNIKGVYKRGKSFYVNIRTPEGVKYFGTFKDQNEANEVAINKYAEIHQSYFDRFANVA